MMRSYAPSDGDNLLGMDIDLVGRLSGLAALNSTSVSVRRTADPKALIVAECETANGCTVDQAMRAVTQAWLGDIGYSYSESHHVTTSTEVGVFEGLTQIGPGGFFVTCRVTIRAILANTSPCVCRHSARQVTNPVTTRSGIKSCWPGFTGHPLDQGDRRDRRFPATCTEPRTRNGKVGARCRSSPCEGFKTLQTSKAT